MNWFVLVSALVISSSVLATSILAHELRMVRLHNRQSSPKYSISSSTDESQASESATKSDPGLKLVLDSDAELSPQHEESMRLLMRAKAEAVISSHSGVSLSQYEVERILTGVAPSLHPGTLSNVSWTLDMYESGITLPTTSSSHNGLSSNIFTSSSFSVTYSPSSAGSDGKESKIAHLKTPRPDSDDRTKLGPLADDVNTLPTEPNTKPDDRDLNHDGIISVDELLHSFFHADNVKNVFDEVQAQTNQKLDKAGKKEIIKKSAPALHKTIEKVASHRGWGIQDLRLARLHRDSQEEMGDEAFKDFIDYNTLVKTMRSALITPEDAAIDTAKEQQEAPRTDPATKA
ncbi:uncharacterized protein MEPE_01850 [Melanopsichium pennsylvanicum]|uniref:EF-hand domain-containing protein n=2 Tax=Melanopsichium pennsylvanicum TaxID=63383 RepID=A0AAJ5C453_9BASI|nr:hypothetical protein BN887_04084 [Melanopsichium pennsylvanicum 4]SNX83144.1 uncharacterized protein MEPE_01850 [Melanopsichium pennsylvanicum]